MIVFDANKIYQVLMGLHFGANWIPPWKPFSVPLDQYEKHKTDVDFLCTELAKTDLQGTLASAEELRTLLLSEDIKTLPEPPKWLDPRTNLSGPFALFPTTVAMRFVAIVKELLILFEKESISRVFMMVPFARIGYYDGSKVALSEKARDKFPLAQRDMQEAAKCFVFRRNSACVFHVMRAMERTVQALGKKFEVPRFDKKPWGVILNEAKHKIDRMKSDTPRRKAKQAQFLNCYRLLHSYCEGIRNPTIHPKIAELEIAYTEEELENLIANVRDFINSFVSLPR